MENIICPRCNQPAYKNRITKGVCFNCYRKYEWKQKLIACKRCGRMMPNQAKGFCRGCYNSLFHINKTRSHNVRKLYNLDFGTYLKITDKCAICGFDKIIDLHHIDKNKANNSHRNLVGLCPNHHKMLHDRKHQEEVIGALKQRGYKIPNVFYKNDEFYKNKPTIKASSPKVKLSIEEPILPPITIEQIREATKFVDEIIAPIQIPLLNPRSPLGN